jgi:hypothetical protein
MYSEEKNTDCSAGVRKQQLCKCIIRLAGPEEMSSSSQSSWSIDASSAMMAWVSERTWMRWSMVQVRVSFLSSLIDATFYSSQALCKEDGENFLPLTNANFSGPKSKIRYLKRRDEESYEERILIYNKTLCGTGEVTSGRWTDFTRTDFPVFFCDIMKPVLLRSINILWAK